MLTPGRMDFLQERNRLEALADLVRAPARPSLNPRNTIASELIETSSAAVGSNTNARLVSTKAALAPPGSFNGLTQKAFGCSVLFLLLQPKNAFFQRDCGTFSGLAAKTKQYLELERACMSNLD